MSELLEFAFSGINLIPTALLIFVVIYWCIAIFGLIDMEALDIDLDVDMDTDVEIGGFASLLSFFNIGHMPLMIFVTFFTIPLWMITLLVNDYLGFYSWYSQVFVFIPAIIGCLFIAKLLTTPIAKFYRKVRQNTEAIENIIGQVCTAKLKITSDKISQAEINVEGTSVLVSVKTRDKEYIDKGDTGLIVEQSPDLSYYLVEPYKL